MVWLRDVSFSIKTMIFADISTDEFVSIFFSVFGFNITFTLQFTPVDPMNDRPDWKFYLKQLAEQCPHSEVGGCG